MSTEFLKGRLVKGIGGFYTVDSNSGKFVVKAKNKFRHKGLTPTIGDEILFSPGENKQNGWIEEILPRKNILIRPPVANIDVLVIVTSPAPKPDYLLVDLLLIAAFIMNIEPIIVFNKCDIASAQSFDFNDYSNIEIKNFVISAASNTGIVSLKKHLGKGLICLAGQSGVGKSTLINSLLSTNLETGKISKIDRGKHTTRHVELITNNGISIFDTPGFSILSLVNEIEPQEIQNYYPEFKKYKNKCKFSPCLHLSEPECAIINAEVNNEIPTARFARYKKIVEIAKENWKNRYD